MRKRRSSTVILPPHVNCVRTRHGEYFYFHPRRGTASAGKSIRIEGCTVLPDGTLNTAWWAQYRALAQEPAPADRPGTFAALISAYKSGADWAVLAPSTRREWSRHLAYIEGAWGHLKVMGLTPVGVRTLIDSRQRTPADANNLLRCLKRLLGWGLERGWLLINPARDTSPFSPGHPYDPWPWDAITYFRDNVSRPDLWHVSAVALFTGQRKGDVLGMRVGHMHGQAADLTVHVAQGKTSKRLRVRLHQAVRALIPELDARRCALMGPEAAANPEAPLLVSNKARAWTTGGFDTVWQAEMDRPEMARFREQRLVFHGLRKSAVVMMLEAGATEHEVMAVTGQSAKMVAYYAQQVNTEKLSAAAILKWEAAGAASE
jgi:integrase